MIDQQQTTAAEAIFPVRPRDWVMSSFRVAQVKAVYEYQGELLADLILLSRTGERIGRESPIEGGPRTFEPMCSLEGWERCREPSFPMTVHWVDQPDGSCVAQYWSERLPSANYRKPKRRSSYVPVVRPDEYRIALERIAQGHNDPRALAAEVLKWSKA